MPIRSWEGGKPRKKNGAARWLTGGDPNIYTPKSTKCLYQVPVPWMVWVILPTWSLTVSSLKTCRPKRNIAFQPSFFKANLRGCSTVNFVYSWKFLKQDFKHPQPPKQLNYGLCLEKKSEAFLFFVSSGIGGHHFQRNIGGIDIQTCIMSFSSSSSSSSRSSLDPLVPSVSLFPKIYEGSNLQPCSSPEMLVERLSSGSLNVSRTVRWFSLQRFQDEGTSGRIFWLGVGSWEGANWAVGKTKGAETGISC